jgi:hypothetical protein
MSKENQEKLAELRRALPKQKRKRSKRNYRMLCELRPAAPQRPAMRTIIEERSEERNGHTFTVRVLQSPRRRR